MRRRRAGRGERSDGRAGRGERSDGRAGRGERSDGRAGRGERSDGGAGRGGGSGGGEGRGGRSDGRAAVADVACVLIFCAVGRRSHDEGVTVAGVVHTAWPFLSGTAIGWLLCRGWRRPLAVAPTGVTGWLFTMG